MCDTFGLITKNNKIFAKNSDRSPNEPQVIQFIKKHKNKNKEVKLTYITIDEVKEVNSILISRPSWMWGAEMGVNEYGLCIGNEAIFTKGKYNKTGITGMDLVRLALERTSNAKEAKDLIIELIQKYNQGGNCGYDHNFFYDNSFLIMDIKEIFILETSGKEYNVRKVSKGAISNCITLPNDNIKEDPLYRKFSGAPIRHKIVSNLLDNKLTIKDTFNILRQHNGNKYFKYGSVSSPCMHAGGIVGDHTTSSMVIDLSNDEINVYFTGTSLPCLSLFKHYTFGDKIEYPISTEINTDYWYKLEKIKRSLLTKAIPLSFYEERNKLENYIINKKIPLSESIKLEEKLYKSLNINKLPNIKRGLYYKWYWNNKNKQLEKSNKIKFEKITYDNLELACKIQNTIFPEEDARQNFIEQINQDPYRKEQDYSIVYVDNKPIGVTGIYSYHEYPESAWLGWFGILKEYRNKGYGKLTLEKTIELAKEKGYTRFRLYTDEFATDAHKLYEKCGLIKELYDNEDDKDAFIEADIYIYSKSLNDEEIDLWNNKMLGLKEQSYKEH